MTTSRELLDQINAETIAYYTPQFSPILVALEARINNELEVAEKLASTLRLMPCGCVREYPYHGKGVKMCVRCRALVLWEILQTGNSEVQTEFDKVKPK